MIGLGTRGQSVVRTGDFLSLGLGNRQQLLQEPGSPLGGKRHADSALGWQDPPQVMYIVTKGRPMSDLSVLGLGKRTAVCLKGLGSCFEIY